MNKTTDMATSKIKTLLKKIHSIVEDEESISKLETDLVKSYLRELYELTDSLGQTPVVHQAPVEAAKKSIITKEHAVSREPNVERTFVPPPPPPVVLEEPVVTVVTEEPKNSDWTKEPTKTPNGRENREIKERPPVYQNDAAEIAVAKEVPEVFSRAIETPKKYAVLFEANSTNELSDKLSRLPISDLHKALSINDRLLFVADLFHGNQAAFGETIDILNTKYSFEEAQSYMIRYLIDRFDWLAEERQERARDFIKLAERRYLDR